MYKIYNAFICGKEFCCSKKPLLIMKLTMVLLTMAFLQASAKTSGVVGTATEVPQKTITGKVVDEKGLPLPGVIVKLKSNASIVTTTDAQGNYKLVSPDDNATVVFSFVGYETQEQSIKGKTTLNISLVPANTGLDEVVVVAYGTQKRTSVTGAVGTVNSDEIRKNSVSDITNTITGRTPGVRIVQYSSQPGKFNSTIDIRGFGSTNGGGITNTPTGQPLFVIDGVPRTQDDFARLDPNEIESFSVLKDATAAIYGVKAANGVVLVTTRKGTQGAVQVNYSGQWGEQIIANYPTLASPGEYAELFDELAFNSQSSSRGDPFTPFYSAQNIADLNSGKTPGTNWLKLVFRRRTNQQQHNVTINGGSDKVRFFTSAGYLQEGGILNSNIEFDRKYNFRQDVNMDLAKGLTLDLNIGIIDVVTQQPNENAGQIYTLVRNTWQINPTELPYLNGDPTKPTHLINSNNIVNPLPSLNPALGGYDAQNARRFSSTATLQYNIQQVPGLTAKLLVGYDNNYSLQKVFNKQFNEYSIVSNVETISVQNGPSYLQDSFHESIRNDIQFSLNYSKHIGKHNFTLLGLYEQVYNTGDYFQGAANFTVDAIDQISAGNNSTATSAGNLEGRSSTRSYVGRLNYDYAGKYLLEAGFREDGSGFLAPATRYGFFPYASAGWRISEEPFIKDNLKWVDNIKIRGSYGKLGDDQAAGARYPYFVTGYQYPSSNPGSVYGNDAGRTGGSEIGTVFGPSGGITKGYDFFGLANPAITWYTSTTTDFGLETSFWNGKLTFEGDIFRRDRNGILGFQVVAIPGNFGAVLPASNLNSDRTQGFELTLGHHNRTGEVTYNITANMGFTRTNWRHYEESIATSPYDNWRNKSSGRYTDLIWGYQVNGQLQNYQQIYNAPLQDGSGNRTVLPGDYNYADLNGDGIIGGDGGASRAGDYTVLNNGGAKPLIYFGSTMDASWRGLDISLLIQGATMYHVTFQDQLSRPFYFSSATQGADPIEQFFDRWHRQNLFDNNSPWVPGRFSSTGQRQQYKGIGFGTSGSQFATGNTMNTYDGTYIRLKQLQIGYTLPKKLMSKIGIKRVRIFATGYNLITWQPYGLNFVDPEYTDTNLYGYNYPITKNFNMGVQLTF